MVPDASPIDTTSVISLTTVAKYYAGKETKKINEVVEKLIEQTKRHIKQQKHKQRKLEILEEVDAASGIKEAFGVFSKHDLTDPAVIELLLEFVRDNLQDSDLNNLINAALDDRVTFVNDGVRDYYDFTILTLLLNLEEFGDITAPFSSTLFSHLIRNNHVAAINQIIELIKNGKLEIKDNENRNGSEVSLNQFVQEAINRSNIKVFKILIDNSLILCTVDDVSDYQPTTLLIHLVQQSENNARIEMASILLEELEVSPDAIVDKESNTTVLMHAAHNGLNGIVSLLIASGANVNAVNDDHETALMLAIQNNRADVIKTLLENGANINAVNSMHMTPLMIAVQSGRIEIVAILIEYNPNPLLAMRSNYTTHAEQTVEDLTKDKAILSMLKEYEAEWLKKH